jgi:hypothetical protein
VTARTGGADNLRLALGLSQEILAMAERGDALQVASFDTARSALLREALLANHEFGGEDRAILIEMARLTERTIVALDTRRRETACDLARLEQGHRALYAYSANSIPRGT